MSDQQLSELIRNVPDFPKPGIQFKDITTVLQNGPAFKRSVDLLVERYQHRPLDAIVAIESRGFIFGAPLAYLLGTAFIPIRKPGKLPADTYQVAYELEYGTNQLEIHRDAMPPGSRVLIVDDLLATGGTITAAIQLVEQVGGVVEELAFLIELTFLKGRDQFTSHPIYSIVQY